MNMGQWMKDMMGYRRRMALRWHDTSSLLMGIAV